MTCCVAQNRKDRTQAVNAAETPAGSSENGEGGVISTNVEERDPAAVGRAHQLVPVARVPLAVGGLERGEEWPRLRRRRERQQLLPEHQVPPHPAPDGVGEPPAHGEAQRVPVRAAAGVEDVQLAGGAHVVLRA